METGNILSMHFTKFCKSEKWKKKNKKIRNWSLLIKVISTVPKLLFSKRTDLYTVNLFFEYADN